MDAPRHFPVRIAAKRLLSEDISWFLLASEPFSFIPGQYVSLRFPGETRFHAFSIASSPEEQGRFELIVKRVHEFTAKLFAAPEGSELECMGPLGRFLQEETLSGDLVMIAGGVGITPFLSVVRHARDTAKEDRNYRLFVSCRSRDQLIAEEELCALPSQNPHIHVVVTLTRDAPDEWEGERGRIDTSMLLRHLGSLEGKTFATCGPAAMVESVVAMLHDAGIPEELIQRESWG